MPRFKLGNAGVDWHGLPDGCLMSQRDQCLERRLEVESSITKVRNLSYRMTTLSSAFSLSQWFLWIILLPSGVSVHEAYSEMVLDLLRIHVALPHFHTRP